MKSLRSETHPGLFDDIYEDVSGVPDSAIQTSSRKNTAGVAGQEKPSLTTTAVAQDRLRVASEQPRRRKTYQWGTLKLASRKRGPGLWTYRYSDVINGKKIRRRKIVGTVLEYPTEAEALRACEHLRMQANAESVQAQVTMRGLIDLYDEKVLQPCLDVPIGGCQDEDASMGHKTASNLKYLLRGWISP